MHFNFVLFTLFNLSNTEPLCKGFEKSPKLGFMSCSTAILKWGQVVSTVTCGSITYTEVTACDLMPQLANH